MDYIKTKYYSVGRATDLEGKDKNLYRFFEIIPGFFAWFTILIILFLSFLYPFYASFFIISFNLYWVFKSIFLSIHLRQNWKRLKFNMSLDWNKRLQNIKYEHIIHLVILPFYIESYEIVEKCILSLLEADVNHKKMAVVLAAEEKRGEEAISIIKEIETKYGKKFGYFLATIHSKGVPGEMAGKGSNITYAVKVAKEKILDKNKIFYEDVIVSVFDIDTVVYPNYFLALTWNFLTSLNPHRNSYQPVPLYNNNIWQTPALSRVVATSGSFWQMIQQERPERLATFSSHSLSFKMLNEIGYWQKNIVSEDSRIFWNAFMAYDGNYEVIPLSYPVSMDANLAPSFFETMKNVYKQQRRWSWGVENFPYILMGFVKNKNISIWKKIKITAVELERIWSLSTNPILIFTLSWFPLLFGGSEFHRTILSYNLPIITRYLIFLGMIGIFVSAIISLSFLPPTPPEHKKYKIIFMFFQWFLIPITLVIFGSIPALDAQTRLMLGKYMGFWITPKHR